MELVLETFEVGRIYTVKKEHKQEGTTKYIFIHSCKPFGGGTVKINYSVLGSNIMYEGSYTDPAIWEEVQ